MENNNKIVQIIKSEITQFPNNCYLSNDTLQYDLDYNKPVETNSAMLEVLYKVGKIMKVASKKKQTLAQTLITY